MQKSLFLIAFNLLIWVNLLKAQQAKYVMVIHHSTITADGKIEVLIYK